MERQNISEYIKDINIIIVFKDFLISSFDKNDNNKLMISKKIEKTILYNEKQEMDIIEQNFIKYNDIEFFQGIINNIGIDLDKKLEKTKGIMKYKNREIFNGNWENDEKLNGKSEYNNNILEDKINIYVEEENKNVMEEKELNELIKNIDLITQYCQI